MCPVKGALQFRCLSNGYDQSMPMATIMKNSNVVRALLVFVVISTPSMAAIYSATTALNSAAPDSLAFKPLDIIFSGNTRPNHRQRPEGYRGFSGFVREVRSAVKSTGGTRRISQGRSRSFTNFGAEIQTADPTYETSIPIRTGRNSGTEETTEVFVGFSVKQILSAGPPGGKITGERSSNSIGSTTGSAIGLGGASGRRGSSGSGGNFLGGGFLTTGGFFTTSGFGLDLRPLTYPKDLGNEPYVRRQPNDPDINKRLKALRQMVLDLVFHPLVYFSALVVFVLMFMSRFRKPAG